MSHCLSRLSPAQGSDGAAVDPSCGDWPTLLVRGPALAPPAGLMSEPEAPSSPGLDTAGGLQDGDCDEEGELESAESQSAN